MRLYSMEISLKPQKKRHSRRLILNFEVEANSIAEARQIVLDKCYQEGLNLLNFKLKELNTLASPE